MLSIDRSGYYAWLKRGPSKRELSNKELDILEPSCGDGVFLKEIPILATKRK